MTKFNWKMFAYFLKVTSQLTEKGLQKARLLICLGSVEPSAAAIIPSKIYTILLYSASSTNCLLLIVILNCAEKEILKVVKDKKESKEQ